MSAHHNHTHNHDHGSPEAAQDPKYRKILWFALIVNAAMFAIELGAGFRSGSVSLLADAIDSAWEDLLVAVGMAGLAIWGGWSVIRHARFELNTF